MYNVRYHIASLVAVFLALALGLVLGGIVGQSGVITKQRSALVQGLREDFKKLSEENKDLKTNLDSQQQLSEALLTREISTRLEGRTVLVVGNSGQTQGLQAAEQAIRAAGGTPEVVSLAKPGLGLGDPDVKAALASVLDTASPSIEGVADQLAREWVLGGPRPVTEALIGARVLSSSASATETGAGAVVVLAGFDGKPDQGALELGRAAMDAGAPAVAAQQADSKLGLAAAGAGKGLSAVDTLGTLVGRYTLVMLLDGAAKGYYGTGEGAVGVYPGLQP